MAKTRPDRPVSLMAPSCPVLPTLCHCVTKVIEASYYRLVAEPRQRPMSELKPRPMASTPQGRAAAQQAQQSQRKMLALALLVVAFLVVLVTNRDFWFGGDEAQDIDLAQPQVAQQTAVRPAPAAVPARHVPAPVAQKHAATASIAETKPVDAPTVTGTRTVLAPLNVEVVAGDSHRTVSPGSNTTKLEIVRPGTTSAFTAKLAAPTNAAEVRPMSATHAALGSGDGSYPLLAQQMKVQGSVLLQALIGADGIIQNLRVLSGPAILASAARQAVSQWKFKPIVENGQAVESKAMITVNFTINVADGATTTASLHPSSDLVIEMAE